MLVCLCVCLFSIEIQTTRQILMKFGTEVVLEGGGKVLGVCVCFDPVPPRCLWSLNRALWQKLYKTKVAGRP